MVGGFELKRVMRPYKKIRKRGLKMICKKCGKELENEAKICAHCGAPVTDEVEIVPEDKYTGASPQAAEKKDNLKTAKKIILLALEICFFLPFCTIACGSYSVTITGLTAAIGNSSADIAPAIYPAILFLMPLIALILIFKNRLNRTEEEEKLSDNFSLATGVVDLTVLLILYIHITSRIKSEIGSDSVSEVLTFKLGYVFEVLLNIALVALFIYQRRSKEASR